MSFKIKIAYRDSKDGWDPVDMLGHLEDLEDLGDLGDLGDLVLNLILLGSRVDTSQRQSMKQILTFSRLDHCTLAANFLRLKS